MIRLYSADVCPFAQRTHALLMHLGVAFDLEPIDLDHRDPEFLKLTPTGKVPLLIDGALKLYESAVINEYLAESHGFDEAFDAKPTVRARERLAILAWDQTVEPAFYAGLKAGGRLEPELRHRVQGELQELLKTVHLTEKRIPSLLAFHCAPFWARMTWLADASPIASMISEWIDLKSWLDRAVAIPAIQSTLPDRDDTVRRYRERFGPG